MAVNPEAELSVKMRTILAYAASGYTLDQIAHAMYISYSNVANTVQGIKERTGGTTVASLACFALAYGSIVAGLTEGCYEPVVPVENEQRQIAA